MPHPTLYINKSVNFKSMKCMSMEIDNIMECVSIELCINSGKNIIVTCVYRTCGSSIAAFSEQIQLLMQKVKNNKTVFLCGDMNVDLLKYGSDANTTHYVDTMFSLGLYPTLIDNIFTNELGSTISSGLIINDSSDHLPIFAICKYKDVQRTLSPKFRLIRKTSDSCIVVVYSQTNHSQTGPCP